MSQAFFEWPIAKAGVGDIGMYTGAVAAMILFVILRMIGKKLEKWLALKHIYSRHTQYCCRLQLNIDRFVNFCDVIVVHP